MSLLGRPVHGRYRERAGKEAAVKPSALLGQVPFFACLGEDELRDLAALCRRRTFERGAVLFHTGDPGEVLYVLMTGQVKVELVGAYGEATILHLAGPGETLGELSLVDGEPRSATAVALERVEVLTLYRDDFLSLLDRRRSVERSLLKRLAAMVRSTNEHVHDVSSMHGAARLAKKLLELADGCGERTPGCGCTPIRLTQQDLAALVGLTRASVNRYLSGFESEGILTTSRDGILLRNPEELRSRLL
jgi:CRP-like cAMP-binding protein